MGINSEQKGVVGKEPGINSDALLSPYPVLLLPTSHAMTETSDLPWEDDEEEEEEEEEDEEEDEDVDLDLSIEETPIKQVKRAAPHKQTSLAKVGGKE